MVLDEYECCGILTVTSPNLLYYSNVMLLWQFGKKLVWYPAVTKFKVMCVVQSFTVTCNVAVGFLCQCTRE